MKKLHFSVKVNAPKEKVWDSMLGEDTYRTWTAVFAPDSHFEGSWEKGADIKFLAHNSQGQLEGMVSRIKDNQPYEFISIEHLGVMKDGQLDTADPAMKGWAGALENYTFTENNGVTTVDVDMDSLEENATEFEQMWPKALQKLKEIAES